jgi:hypothetical protein
MVQNTAGNGAVDEKTPAGQESLLFAALCEDVAANSKTLRNRRHGKAKDGSDNGGLRAWRALKGSQD